VQCGFDNTVHIDFVTGYYCVAIDSWFDPLDSNVLEVDRSKIARSKRFDMKIKRHNDNYTFVLVVYIVVRSKWFALYK
jgi:hypothetical protein